MKEESVKILGGAARESKDRVGPVFIGPLEAYYYYFLSLQFPFISILFEFGWYCL
jgi:hypothetical protein